MSDVLDRLVSHVAPALEEAGDLADVRQRLGDVLRRGTGARAQRDAADPRAAVALAVRRTPG